MNKDIRIRYWDWLLIIGAVLAPMTEFRIWKIGPAEVLCFIWAIRYIRYGHIIVNEYVKFFVVFLSSMIIGLLFCAIVAPSEFGIGGIPTWFFISFFACTLLLGISQNDLSYNYKLFDSICVLSVLWYAFLYIYSILISKSLLGAPLWFHQRFSGGAKNPHQVAVMFCTIAFWFTRRLSRRDRPLASIICFAITVFLEMETKSSTGTVTIFLGSFVFLVLFTTTYMKGKKARMIALLCEFLIGILVAILFYGVIYRAVYEWISDDANGLGRFYIWASFKNMFSKSPLFGLGPGRHAVTQFGTAREFHNSYLEIYAISGMVGFLAFVRMTVWKYKTVIKGDKLLMPILVSAYGYSLAGFAFRRLVYWIILTFTVVIASQITGESEGHIL